MKIRVLKTEKAFSDEDNVIFDNQIVKELDVEEIGIFLAIRSFEKNIIDIEDLLKISKEDGDEVITILKRIEYKNYIKLIDLNIIRKKDK